MKFCLVLNLPRTSQTIRSAWNRCIYSSLKFLSFAVHPFHCQMFRDMEPLSASRRKRCVFSPQKMHFPVFIFLEKFSIPGKHLKRQSSEFFSHTPNFPFPMLIINGYLIEVSIWYPSKFGAGQTIGVNLEVLVLVGHKPLPYQVV